MAGLWNSATFKASGYPAASGQSPHGQLIPAADTGGAEFDGNRLHARLVALDTRLHLAVLVVCSLLAPLASQTQTSGCS